MKKRRWMLCALALSLGVCLTACGGQDKESNEIPTFSEYLSSEGTKILYYANEIGKDKAPKGVMVIEDGEVNYTENCNLTFGEYANMSDEDIVQWMQALNMEEESSNAFRTQEAPYLLYVTTDSTGNQVQSEAIAFPVYEPTSKKISWKTIGTRARYDIVYSSVYCGLTTDDGYGLLARIETEADTQSEDTPDYQSPYTLDTVQSEGVEVDWNEQDIRAWASNFPKVALCNGAMVSKPEDGSTFTVTPVQGEVETPGLSADSVVLGLTEADIKYMNYAMMEMSAQMPEMAQMKMELRLGMSYQELNALGYQFDVQPGTQIQPHQVQHTTLVDTTGILSYIDGAMSNNMKFVFYNDSDTPRPVDELPVRAIWMGLNSLLSYLQPSMMPCYEEYVFDLYGLPNYAYIDWTGDQYQMERQVHYLWKGEDCYLMPGKDGSETVWLVQDIPEVVDSVEDLKKILTELQA